MLVDYHTHTRFSADSQAPMADQCRAAIEKGVAQIAFTEHEDYNPKDETSFYFQHADYLRELARCREMFAGQLIIRAGIEISEPHTHAERAAEVLSKYEWDFVLGSLHWMHGSVNAFTNAFTNYKSGWREAFRDYFTEMITLAQVGDFDILSHIDYPARYNRDVIGEHYDIGDYEEIIREVLRQVVTTGKGIEINTSAWRKSLPDPNPPAKVIKWYRELGGEILTVGSDAHTPKDISVGIERALGIARDAGFTHIATFERRQPIFVKIRHYSK